MLNIHKGPLSVEEYYSLGKWQRFRYSLIHHPRRVAEVTLLLIGIFVEWMGITIVAPLTPWFIQKLSPNMDAGKAASIMIAAYAAGTTLGSIVSGSISDKIGRRPVFLTGLFLYAASYFLAANAWDIASFAGFRALGGFSSGTRPVFMAFLGDTCHPKDLTFYGMLLSIAVNGGMSIGPILGGSLALVDLTFPLYLFGAITSLIFVLLFFLLRESRRPHNKKDQASSVMFQPAQKERNKWMIPTIICLALISLSIQYLFTGWSTVFGVLGVERYKLNSAENGLVFGIAGILMILISLLYVPWTRYILNPALTGAVGMAISSLLVIEPFLYNIYWATVVGTVVGIGCCLFFSGIAYFINTIAPAGRRGLVSSFVMTSSNIGGIIGPIVSGALYDADPIHRAYPFYVFLGCSLLSLLLCIVVDRGLKYTETHR